MGSGDRTQLSSFISKPFYPLNCLPCQEIFSQQINIKPMQHPKETTSKLPSRSCKIQTKNHTRILGLLKALSLHLVTGFLFLQLVPLRYSEWLNKLGSEVWCLLCSQRYHYHCGPLKVDFDVTSVCSGILFVFLIKLA